MPAYRYMPVTLGMIHGIAVPIANSSEAMPTSAGTAGCRTQIAVGWFKAGYNPLFAQQFVMAAGSHEHGGTIIANP